MVCVTPIGCRGLLLCTSCVGTPDTGSLERAAAASDHPLQAAKVSTIRAWPWWRETDWVEVAVLGVP